MDESIDYKSLPSEEQKELAVRMYIESRTDPNAKPLTQTEVAKMFGRSQTWMSAALIDDGTIERIEKRTHSNVVLARAMMQHAAPKVAEETIKSAMKSRAAKYEYITQQDRRDVLDRAGVRTEKQEATEVTVRFADGIGFETGMPDEVE